MTIRGKAIKVALKERDKNLPPHVSHPYFQIPSYMAYRAICAKFTGADWAVWTYVQMLDPFGEETPKHIPSIHEFAKALFLSDRQVRRSLWTIKNLGLLPDWMPIPEIQDLTERIVRDRLQSQLGGLTEVVTAIGRVDLLTETEVIEVKHISEWKAAMGQVLAYSNFYPEHQKRLHLFHSHNKPLAQAREVKHICLALSIIVTFEEV